MRKLIAAINMTLDGFCDHTAGIANSETHRHYIELLKHADIMMWGRVTYELMENYWPELAANPSGDPAMDEFAKQADNIEKWLFSRTRSTVEWKNTVLKNELVKEEIVQLKQQEGKAILVGSPGLIVACTNLDLIDEYQLCIHPVILGSGLTLFKNIEKTVTLKLLHTKTFDCGPVVHYYQPANK